MIPNDCPPANPCNGTAPTAPPSTTDEHQYSAWYHHVKAGLDAWEIWQDLDDAGKLDVILTHYSATQWLNPEELAVLVQFRHQPPGRWAQIKLRYREIGGSPHDLQWEVDKLLKTQGAPQAPAGSVRPRFQTIPAPALYGKDLPPQDWVVQDILPVGATLFTGRGKDGKSLMAWNLCLAVATGGTALSHYAATAGDVLYLALEDGERRAQQRLKEQMAFMGTTDVPPTLELVLWDAPTIGDGFEEALTTWLDEHPQARLVVIDILEKIRPRRARNGSVYADDYAAIAPLQRLAQERGIAILIVHHSNKTKPDDFRDTASGSMGLIGACDTFWSLQRIAGEPDAALRIIGRDVEAQELALRFEAGFWTVLGDAATVLLNTAHQLILDTLMTEGRPLTPTMLATMLGVNLNTMKSHLTRLHERGLVLNLGNGHYIARIATPEHASDDQRATPATPATPATGAPAEPGTSAADVQGEEVLELPEESIPLTPALSTEAILADEACLTAGDGDSEVPGPTPRANDDHAQERTREGCTVAPVARVAGGAGVEALGLDGHVQPPSNGHHPGGAQPGPTLPCVVCGSVARWHDRGTMRCSRCWPPR